MKTNCLWLFLLVLIGCKHERQEETWSPDGPPYLITDSGVFVYWESEKDPDVYSAFTREEIENFWIDTQQCLSMASEPPTVVITDNIQDFCGLKEGGKSGYCGSMDPRIIVHTAQRANSTDLGNVRPWKHEFIHHIMDMNERHEHADHKPDFLWQCQYN